MVEGKPVEINPIGAMKDGDRQLVIVNDMEGLVAEDEYMIFEIVPNILGGVSLTEITDLDYYNHLCDTWEKYLDELEDAEIDS